MKCLLVLLAACGSSKSAAPDGPVDAMVDACVPTRTCETPSTFCGEVDDGCGTPLACGDCVAPLACGLATPNVCGIAEANRECNASGWCWQHPLPFGMNFTALYGAAADDVWATGEAGTLMHYDGTAWHRVASGTDADVHGVWGAAANDVWITGTDYVRRWNGTALAIVAGAPTDLDAADVHGTAANDVWIAGGFGAANQDLWHYDGATWTSYPDPTFFAPERIFAVSPTLAFAASFGDTMMWNGTAWTELENGAQTTYDVWASSATEAWFAGWNGVARFDGASWTTKLDPAASDMLAIDGTSATDLLVGGTDGLHRFDGTTWTTTPTDATIRTVTARDATRTWAAGDGGRTLRWDGTSWSKRTGFGTARPIFATWASDAHDVWLLGDGALRWRDGQVDDYGDLAPDLALDTAWGASGTDIWAAGKGGAFAHWDGTAWTVSHPIAMLPTVTAMWGFAANDIYAVTEATDPFSVSDADVLHWDGTAWSVAHTLQLGASPSTLAVDLVAIGGSGPNDLWVAPDRGGQISHFDGTQWTTGTFIDTYTDASDFWTSPTGTVWAATSSGVYRRTGTTWTQAGSSTPAAYITGISDTDVYVTPGADRRYPPPLVNHFNGSSWTTENTGAGQFIGRLAITSDSLFAAGQSGGLVRKPR